MSHTEDRMTNRGIVAAVECPYCGHFLDDATGRGDRQTPEPDDICVCIECSGVMEFDKDLIPCIITDIIWQRLPQDLQDHIKSVQFIKETHDLPNATP